MSKKQEYEKEKMVDILLEIVHLGKLLFEPEEFGETEISTKDGKLKGVLSKDISTDSVFEYKIYYNKNKD